MHTQHWQQGSNSRPKEEGYFYHGQRCQIMLVWRGLYKCKLYRWAISPGKGLYVNALIGPERSTHPGQISRVCGKCAAKRHKQERDRECYYLMMNCEEQGGNSSKSMERCISAMYWIGRTNGLKSASCAHARSFSHWNCLRPLRGFFFFAQNQKLNYRTEGPSLK